VSPQSFLYTASTWLDHPKEGKSLPEKTRIDPMKTKEMQERTRERSLIIQEIRNRGPLTVEELSEITGMEKSRLLMQLIAMRQFGKVTIAGERNDQFIYGLPKESA
jgi:uncharacterized protein YcaQ